MSVAGYNMCRMIAIYERYDEQSNFLTAFRRLSAIGKVPKGSQPGHRDGWGILIYDANAPTYVGRFATDPGNDPAYERALEKVIGIRPKLLLVHFRKASIGAISIANTQPFVDSQWSFGHNGTIWSPALNRMENETDSAAYFRLLLSGLTPNSPAAEETLSAAVKKIRHDISLHPDSRGRTYSSLTFILSDGKSVYAMRDFANKENENHYTIYYSVLETGVVFCQEKVIESEWELIPNRTLAACHGDGEIRTVSCE